MLTNHYPGLARGPIDHNASSVINSIAGNVIEMGSVVKLATIPAAELLPQVIEATGAGDIGYGIAVGGDADGIYSTTGVPDAGGDNTKAAAGQNQGVVVVTQGRCLARVTNATAIIIGAPLSASATAGVLELANAASDHIIARALQAPTSTTDIIAVDVQREGLLT